MLVSLSSTLCRFVSLNRPTTHNIHHFPVVAECDEPRYCHYRTDCSDCGNCGGHRRAEGEEGEMVDNWEFIAEMERAGMH